LKTNIYLCFNPDRATIEKIKLEYRFLLPVKEEYPREVRGRWLKKTTPSFQKKWKATPLRKKEGKVWTVALFFQPEGQLRISLLRH